ncbi:stemar-13-ene synthase-like [Oryza brachyantha]|nr:stemar-13-ene synthase-like [Oryza brachyantha]
MHRDELKATVRKQLREGGEPSPSSYDTAWVAMVPLRGFPHAPCYPQCVQWILDNQQPDGSWGQSAQVNKDILLSTLACVVALKRWNTGPNHIRRGLRFIGRNFSVVMDGQSVSPVGFNITFSGLLKLASEMGLEIPVIKTDIDGIFYLREIELARDGGGTVAARKAFMAYVSEGLGRRHDWNLVMPYQRNNGSLFNSPSTTAAAAIYSCNDRALDYLGSLTSKFGGSVPVIYPDNVYSQLCMVNTLEKMGISSDFASEIQDILDMTYSCWMQNEEEIMSDMATCAKAFRLLRMNGYDITSDGMGQFAEQSCYDDSIHAYVNDIQPLLELYRSSQVRFSEDDLILEKIGSWSAKLLKQQLSTRKISKPLVQEIEYALEFPIFATVEPLEHKGNIERFKTNSFQLLKSGHCANPEILSLAIDKFGSTQSIFQQELQEVNRWVKEHRLDELKFARILPLHAYFCAVVPLFPPELSAARVAWSQNAVLTTAVDDLFDGEGSMEELRNLVEVIEKWDNHAEVGFVSERVEILFKAVYNTTRGIGAVTAQLQNRSVMDHLAELWAMAVRGMLTEAEWRMSKYIPATMEEYMSAAEYSFAYGPIIPASAYLLGEPLPEEAVRSEEYTRLLQLASTVGRLINDAVGVEREMRVGKPNSVVVQAAGGCGAMSLAAVEAAKEEVRRAIRAARWELQRLAFRDGAVVPRRCRELSWHGGKVASFFYREEDAYTNETMWTMANAVIVDPLQLQ